MTRPLLSVSGLDVELPTAGAPIPLVEGFDLDIAEGERVALVGETGSGKTLVARSLMRLATGVRVSGRAEFRSRNLFDLTEEEMRQIRGARMAMVFQDPFSSLNPLMTIGDQIAEPLRVAGVPRREALERAGEMLGEIGVAGAAGRLSAYPHEFSGGMRQRVALAIALIGEPELLIADEPTTALDVRVQAQVLALLDRVTAERGLAVLLITHDLAAVAGFCDRVAVMYSGRKVHEDAVESIFRAPAHPYTAALLDALPRIDRFDQPLRPIPGVPPRPASRPAGCSFHPRCERAEPRCATDRPATYPTPGGGSVACHHPRGEAAGVAP